MLIIGIWYFAVPEVKIHDLIQNSVDSQNIIVKTEGIKKEVFLSLRIEKIEINRKTNNITLAVLQDMQIKPDFISLLKLNPVVQFRGNTYGGFFEGLWNMKEKSINMVGKDIKIEEIHFLNLFKITGYGNLSFKADMGRSQGQITFKVIDTKLKNTILPGGYILPLDLFNEIKGLLKISNNVIEVRSFTLEGKNIYARIKGNIRDDVLDLTMELMPGGSFENRHLLLLIEPFKISPGYYVIPVSIGNLKN